MASCDLECHDRHELKFSLDLYDHTHGKLMFSSETIGYLKCYRSAPVPIVKKELNKYIESQLAQKYQNDEEIVQAKLNSMVDESYLPYAVDYGQEKNPALSSVVRNCILFLDGIFYIGVWTGKVDPITDHRPSKAYKLINF